MESRPDGRKARQLATAGFRVIGEQMPTGTRHMVRNPWFVGGVAGGVLVTAVGAARGGFRGAALGIGASALAAPWVFSRIVRRTVNVSVRLQTAALQRHPIDAVVGSSYGAAIAMQLLLRGLWRGPTLLLSPAHAWVTRGARLPATSLADLPDEVSSRVVVVHAAHDQTIPAEHTERLVAGSRARLVRVDDDHRLSVTSTPAQLAEWIAMASA